MIQKGNGYFANMLEQHRCPKCRTYLIVEHTWFKCPTCNLLVAGLEKKEQETVDSLKSPD